MKKILLYTTIIFALFSCAKKANKTVMSEDTATISKTDYKADLHQYFTSNQNTIITTPIANIKLDSLQWVQDFYKGINYSTVWINDSIQLNQNGNRLLQQLHQSKNYGLDTRLYPLSKLRDLSLKLSEIEKIEDRYAIASQMDVLLTYFYMVHGKHLNYGILQSIEKHTTVPRKLFTVNLPNYLKQAYEADSIMERLYDLQPKHQEYTNLQKGLEKYLKTASLSTESINVVNFRKDSILSKSQAKKALVLHQYLSEENKDSLFVTALEKFQTEHALKSDGVVGSNTAKALTVSPNEYYQRLVVDLERWRWKEPFNTTRIYVNIPSYELQLFKNDNLVDKHIVVVGSYKNQTPEMIDSLKYVIAYPYWNVPRKISVKEILGKIKRDSTYLSRNGYEIMTKDRETVDPTSVDWTAVNSHNFNYLIRQGGGSSNALGLVKFIFPNKDAIYLHDTPSKRFFKRERRAYSHGCVRVQNALGLAKYLLDEDANKYNIKTVNSSIKEKKERWIRLNKKVSIYIQYVTTAADDSGSITFYEDVYKLDKPLMKDLNLVINSKSKY